MRYLAFAGLFLVTLQATSRAEEAKSLTLIAGIWDRIDKNPEGELVVAYGYGSTIHDIKQSQSHLDYKSYIVRGCADDKVALDSITGIITRATYMNPIIEKRHGVSKVTLSHGRIWVVAPGGDYWFAIPIKHFQDQESGHWGGRVRTQRGDKSRAETKWAYRVSDLLFPAEPQFFPAKGYGWGSSAEPLPDMPGSIQGVRRSPIEQQIEYSRYHASYDFLPTSAETVISIQLYRDELVFQGMSIGKPFGKFNTAEDSPPLTNTKALKVKAPFEGGFWAYAAGDTYYLLAHTGKLYAVKKKDKETLEIVAVWEDKTRPLIGAIQDVTNRKVFVFGKDQKDGERFAFEFGLEPKVTKYKTEAKAGDGFKEAQDCVRAVKAAAQKK